MTAIADLPLPPPFSTIRGIVFRVPQGTTDRVPTDTYFIGDDSGEIEVVYDTAGKFASAMFMLEDGNRVELEGIRLPNNKFLAFAGRKVVK